MCIMSQTLFLRLQSSIRQGLLGAGLLVLCGNTLAAGTPALPAASRGELLYATHCISCHNVDIHWRDKRLVTDRISLQREVYRWQETSSLDWSEDDVAEVARYLNVLYYAYPVPK
jgi:hypothetical protein